MTVGVSLMNISYASECCLSTPTARQKSTVALDDAGIRLIFVEPLYRHPSAASFAVPAGQRQSHNAKRSSISFDVASPLQFPCTKSDRHTFEA
jgi:hypothetical protein